MRKFPKREQKIIVNQRTICSYWETVDMRLENNAILILDERDIRLSATNGGLAVDLPPQTTRVIVRVVAQLEKAEME